MDFHSYKRKKAKKANEFKGLGANGVLPYVILAVSIVILTHQASPGRKEIQNLNAFPADAGLLTFKQKGWGED